MKRDFKQVLHPRNMCRFEWPAPEENKLETVQRVADYDAVLRWHCRLDEPRIGPIAVQRSSLTELVTAERSSTPWG